MNRNVLIVEDERIVALELEEQLKGLGCHVIGPASTAAAALELCQHEMPDLALMDIRIQGPQDGIESAHVLRKRFDIPVIYLTALADEVTMERAKQSRPASYLLKPVRDDELRAAVEIALHNRQTKLVLEQQRAEFFAMLSHDIRSPLQTVVGLTEILAAELETAHQAEAAELLSRVRDGVAYTLKLVSQYLNGLNFDSEGSGLTRVRLYVNEILRRIKSRHEAEAAIREIVLQTELQEGLPAVEAEQSLLERSFDNLLFNALKFTPPGGRVVLSSESRGDELLLKVADTGPGIPSEDLPRIFDMGWRRSVDAKKEGYGLGLHIVKTMVNALGGRLEVESAVGSGSCFSVYLPAASPSLPLTGGVEENTH